MQKRHNSIANALELCLFSLTPKQLELHGCILSTGATDTLVLKDQTISTHNADKMSLRLSSFMLNIVNNIRKWNYIWQKLA